MISVPCDICRRERYHNCGEYKGVEMNNKKLFFSVASVLIVMCAILSGCTEKNERELEQKAIEKEQWVLEKM